MRTLIIAAIVAAGIGFIGTSGASAAPASGVTIHETANANNAIVKVQHLSLAQPPLAALPLRLPELGPLLVTSSTLLRGG